MTPETATRPTPRKPTGPPIPYKGGKGYGCMPCPGCNERPGPGQDLITEPGVWDSWHAACYEAKELLGDSLPEPCTYCGEHHHAYYDGWCLL